MVDNQRFYKLIFVMYLCLHPYIPGVYLCGYACTCVGARSWHWVSFLHWSNLTFWERVCDDSSWLSNWHLELTKTQLTGAPVKIFLNYIIWNGRPIFNPDLLSWEDSLLIWSIPSVGTYIKDMEDKRALLLISLASSLALESTSFRLWHITTTWDIY